MLFRSEPPSSTLSLLPHAQRQCGFLFVFSDLLWASGLVFVFVAVGLCSLWVFFFCCGLPVMVVVVLVFSDLLWASGHVFVLVAVGLCSLWVFFFLLWIAGSGGGGGGGGCAYG